MKRTISIFMIVIIIIAMFSMLAACSGGSSLPDGIYEHKEGYYRPLCDEFIVKGKKIIIDSYFKGIRYTAYVYTYKIKGNEIMLIDEDGNEDFYSFEKKSDKTYFIDGDQYTKIK